MSVDQERLGGADEEDMSLVNRHPNGPTDPEEMGKLASRYAYDEATGSFIAQAGDPA